MADYKPHLKRAILEVVENQLRAGDPPQTKQTFDRLVAAGHSEDEATRLIGCAVSCEMFEVMRDHRVFDLERFAKALAGLPTMPWDQPGGPYEDRT